MKIEENVSLKNYNTFHLEYIADCIIHLFTEKATTDLFRKDHRWKEPMFILGSGSNLLFRGDFRGTILHPRFGGIEIESENNDHVVISAGAGINWDDLVEWTVENGLSGLENLSLIPGCVGASPVQNIGAYGREVRESIEKVEAVSISDGTFTVFSNPECEFRYRYSIFKGREKGRYLVTRVYFRLSRKPDLMLDYGMLKDEVKRLGAESVHNVRKAVINIRRNKLPDPDQTGNAGSFFKNPVIPEKQALEIKRNYAMMPAFLESEGMIKVPAAWLIEQCGWKGKRVGNAGVHEKHALILINLGNATGDDIFLLSEEIRKSVKEKFDIGLEREVEVIPN
ncbi:MAG TPA: UDP-N-acetylmuramate dehydrogenase [Bacteroidales bacterium]|jgi:UDP-N-acetylmuramate dehydrogenase|nr:UDP-N-acetylmuramate dehydrogenase [Bacteroidales bacterium]